MGGRKVMDEHGFCNAQNQFNRALNRYVNKGIGKSPDKLVEQYQYVRHLDYTGEREACEIAIEPYQGDNVYAHNLSSYLKQKAYSDLYCVLVHGSVGSYEEVAYSDFDALVVLRDHAFQSVSQFKKVCSILRYGLRFMYRFDPLQHHGWLVLTECDLGALSEAYFPAVLFDRAKGLITGHKTALQIQYRGSENESCDQLNTLLHSVRRILDSGIYRKNVFYLKSLLSQFMLLPAIYLQAKEGRGVWKGDSFQRARYDFSESAWAGMEHASALRQDWAYPLSTSRKVMLTQPGWMGDKLRKSFSPSIPVAITGRLTPEFIANMYAMTEEIYTNANMALSA